MCRPLSQINLLLHEIARNYTHAFFPIRSEMCILWFDVRSTMLAYPVDVRVNSRVDARFTLQRAQYTPAGDTGQLPRLPVAGLAHQRTTGVARARVATTLLVPGADHVHLQTLTVPATQATH